MNEIIDPQMIPISKLGLDRRSTNVLPDWGVHTVKDLMELGVEGLRNIRNLGHTSVKLIGRRMRDLGFDLPGFAQYMEHYEEDYSDLASPSDASIIRNKLGNMLGMDPSKVPDWMIHQFADPEPKKPQYPLCKSKTCAGDGTAKSFNSQEALEEYQKTGLCQACQDEVFNGEEW